MIDVAAFTPDAHFVTVFDAAQKPVEWGFPAFGLLFVSLSAVLWKFRDAPGLQWAWHWPMRGRPRARKIWCAWALAFSILWTTVAGCVVFGDAYSARRALRSGRTEVVEGWVENFVAMRYSGHADEHFDVAGVHFAYSDYEVSAGFNHTASHGGPMRAELYVRIHYVRPERPEILKLEIAR